MFTNDDSEEYRRYDVGQSYKQTSSSFKDTYLHPSLPSSQRKAKLEQPGGRAGHLSSHRSEVLLGIRSSTVICRQWCTRGACRKCKTYQAERHLYSWWARGILFQRLWDVVNFGCQRSVFDKFDNILGCEFPLDHRNEVGERTNAKG